MPDQTATERVQQWLMAMAAVSNWNIANLHTAGHEVHFDLVHDDRWTPVRISIICGAP